MEFESWWEYHGQRNLAFDARQWAECGWKGHELHAGEVIDADVPLLEDLAENTTKQNENQTTKQTTD